MIGLFFKILELMLVEYKLDPYRERTRIFTFDLGQCKTTLVFEKQSPNGR